MYHEGLVHFLILDDLDRHGMNYLLSCQQGSEALTGSISYRHCRCSESDYTWSLSLSHSGVKLLSVYPLSDFERGRLNLS